MASTRLFSAPSTHLVFEGVGSYYGISISPAAGGTVVVADIVDIGHAPEMSTASTAGNVPGAFQVLGPWPADSPPTYVESESTRITNGLSVSYTSTTSVTVYYDQ